MSDSSLWLEFEILPDSERGFLNDGSLESRTLIRRLLSEAPEHWVRTKDTVDRGRLLDWVVAFLKEASSEMRENLVGTLDKAVWKTIRGRSPKDIDPFYQGVFDRIRPPLNAADSDPTGWCSLLINIGDLSWKAHEGKTALVVIEEAWKCAQRSPTPIAKVRTTAILAILETQVRSTVRGLLTSSAELDRNRKRIRDTVPLLEAMLGKFPDLVGLRLRCGLAESALFQLDGRIDRVTRSRGALQALHCCLAWCLGDSEGQIGIFDRLDSKIPAAAKNVMIDVMIQMARHSTEAGVGFGASDRALALDYLDRISLDPRRRVELLLDLANNTSDHRFRSEKLTLLAHLVHAGDLDALEMPVRTGLAKRYSDLAKRVSEVYHRIDAHFTAFFWEWEALRVRERLLGEPLESAEGSSSMQFAKRAPLSSRLVPKERGPRVGTRERTLDDLVGIGKALRAGSPFALVVSMRGLAMAGEDDWPILAELADPIVAGVSHWIAQLDITFRPEVLLPQNVDSRGSFRIACLLLADTVAREFQPELQAEIQENLSSIEDLAPDVRAFHARNSVDWAYRSGRWIQAAEATVSLFQALDDCEDREGVRCAATDLCKGFVAEVAQSSSGIGLFELLKSGSKNLAAAAEWLANHFYAREAFLVTQVSVGWLCQAMAAEPGIVDDYEAVQRVTVDNNDNDREALFLRMEQRMLQGQAEQARMTGVMVDVPFVAGRILIQFLFAQSIWAVVAVQAFEGAPEYHAVELFDTREELEVLTKWIWAQLAARRAVCIPGAPIRTTESLEQLHAKVIAPLEKWLTGMDEVVFTTDDVIAQLPLHAARSHEGFLIERLRCRYFSHRWSDQATPTASGESPTMLVGGWDGDIGGPEEARLVRDRLRKCGYAPQVIRHATQGRKALLDDSRSANLLHLVAHGELQPGLLAGESKLQLSPLVHVIASDWIRGGCLPDFAFLNACVVGATNRGDMSGFPLALRVRGVRGSLTSIADLEPQAAHNFADSFYRALPGVDTFEAYLSAMRDMAAAGVHPAAWAPYVYEGESVMFESPPRTTSKRLSAHGGKGRRRRRRYT